MPHKKTKKSDGGADSSMYDHQKIGMWNTGVDNTGDANAGDYNTGIRNSGNRNAGDDNGGHENTGSHNSGRRNSGSNNSGNYNSGVGNTGDLNTGNYNSGHRNSGWFNTDEPKMRFFNKETDLTYSEFKRKFGYLNTDLKLSSWVNAESITEDEKKNLPLDIPGEGGVSRIFFVESDCSKDVHVGDFLTVQLPSGGQTKVKVLDAFLSPSTLNDEGKALSVRVENVGFGDERLSGCSVFV